MKTRFDMRTLAFLAVVSIIAAACGALPGGSGTLTKVSLRYDYKMNAGFAPFFLGIEKGYYKDAGIDLDIGDGTGGAQVVQSLVADQIFMATPGAEIVMRARAQATPVKMVALLQGISPVGLMVLSTSTIKAPKDFAGKTVVAETGSTTAALLPAYLRAAGVDPNSVTVVNIPSSSKIKAMLAKQVDASGGFSSDDFIELQGEDPQARFFAFGDVVPVYGFGLVTTENNIKNKPDLVKKVVQATIKTYRYALDHPNETIDAMLKVAPDHLQGTKESQYARAKATMELFRKAIAPDGCAGCMSDAVFKTMEDLLTQYGGLPKKAAAMSDYYTNEYLK